MTCFPIGCGRTNARELVARRLHGREGHGDAVGDRLQRAKRVEHAEVRRRIEQRLMLVLPVQLDQARGQLFQRAGCGESAVDEGAAPALCGDLAANEDFVAAVLENGFNGRDVFARTNQIA